MPHTNTYVRELSELTFRELAGLHMVNEAFREAELWIREHSVCVQYGGESDSNTAVPSHSLLASDLPLCASAVYMRVAAEPCNAEDHSRAARLEAVAVVGQIGARVDAKGIPLAGEGLFGLRPCALFEALFTELRGDWLQMLAVHALKVELPSLACRKFEVASREGLTCRPIRALSSRCTSSMESGARSLEIMDDFNANLTWAR